MLPESTFPTSEGARTSLHKGSPKLADTLKGIPSHKQASARACVALAKLFKKAPSLLLRAARGQTNTRERNTCRHAHGFRENRKSRTLKLLSPKPSQALKP